MIKWFFLLTSTAVIFLSVSFYFFSSYRDISNVFEKAEKDYELNVKKILTNKANKEKHNSDVDKEENEAIDINDINYGKLFFFLLFLVIVAVVVYYFF